MNLFRSEEHVRNWAQFKPDCAEGITPLADVIALFSNEVRKHLLDGDYISRWLPRQAGERTEILQRLGKTSPFWQP